MHVLVYTLLQLLLMLYGVSVQQQHTHLLQTEFKLVQLVILDVQAVVQEVEILKLYVVDLVTLL